MRSPQEVIDCLNAAPAVAAVRAVAAEKGIPAYLFGGAVRDLFLRRSPRDFDFVIDGDARDFARAILQRVPARGMITGAEPGTIAYRSDALGRVDFIASNGLPVGDFVARHADVTVNTLVFDVRRGRIVDAHGALGDIASRSIRAVPPAGFKTRAPHLPLRAVRMALLTPTFTLDAATRADLGACRRLLAAAPPRDAGYEVYMILKSSECPRGIRMLAELGLLDAVLDTMLPFVPAAVSGTREDVEELTRALSALDDLTAPGDAPAQRLVPLGRHVLLLDAAIRRRVGGTAEDQSRLLVARGDEIERTFNALSARFSSPGVYGFRVRMVATGFAAGRAAIAAGASAGDALVQAVRTLGARKGWLAAALISAALRRQERPS